MNVEEMYAKVMKKKGMTLHPWQVQQQLLYSSEAATSSNAQTQLHRGSVDLGFLSIRDEEPREPSSLIHVSSRRSSVDTSPPQRVGHDVNDSILSKFVQVFSSNLISKCNLIFLLNSC